MAKERMHRDPDQHPFVERPHRTLVVLSIPILCSLVAEPVTGLVDNAFIARLGATEAAALGAATALFSSCFWMLFFIGVGTHTEVANAFGAADFDRARRAVGAALVLAVGLALGAIAIVWPFLSELATWMGATGAMHVHTVDYMEIRLIGVLPQLFMHVCFGAMRGYQQFRLPLWIAIAANLVNLVLDPLLIFGAGTIPAMGVAGAAWASSVSQWVGAALALGVLRKRNSWVLGLHWDVMCRLFAVGRDMLIRTGCLTFFLVASTRLATRVGAEAGAAHLAVRRVWELSAFILDAYAMTAQSLVGYFLGAARVELARRVAGVGAKWSFGTGCVVTLLMLLGAPLAKNLLVPPEAWSLFGAAWLVSALGQPINSLSFITDGVHWGTGDYPYLRNATLFATVVGLGGLWLVNESADDALVQIWLVTTAWISARALSGIVRVWPGIGRRAPLRVSS